MTCASCASRIERKLNKLGGVNASVNYATERAHIELGEPIPVHELIAAIEATGYGAKEHSTGSDAGRRARRSTPTPRRCARAWHPGAALSMVSALQFDGWQWVALAMATPVATWAAWPFHRAMATNLRHGQTTMDTLISVGVSAAYLWSLWALLFTSAGDVGMEMAMEVDAGGGDGQHIYLEVASTVVAFILAGRYFEARAKRRSGDAIRALLDLGAKEVSVLDDDGGERRVPIDDLVVGDRFVVRPGEKIATDGVVVEGASAIDRSLVTGESVPVEVGVGDDVTGATLNSNGRLVVEARRVGADTQLAQLARLVEAAQSGKAPVQRLADRVSSVFVPVVIALAIATLIGWLVTTGDAERSFAAAVAVLIIACPARWGWRRRPPCWWAPDGARNWASSSRVPRSSNRRARSTRSCSTRRARSRPATWNWSGSTRSMPGSPPTMPCESGLRSKLRASTRFAGDRRRSTADDAPRSPGSAASRAPVSQV